MRSRWWLAVSVLASTACTAPSEPPNAPVSAPAKDLDQEQARREETKAMQAMMGGLGEMFARKRREGTIDPQLLEQNRARVEAFLARDHFYADANRGMGFMALFLVSFEDAAVPAETVERAVVGMAAYERRNLHIAFSIAPRHLAERYGLFDPARAALNEGLAIYDPPRPADRPEGDHRWLVTKIYATLAVVEAQAGNVEAAEKALGAARLRGHGGPEQIEEAAGRVALARGELERAERAFVRGLGISRDCLQCREGLEQLHRDRGGTPDDFEAYLERATAEELAARKQRLLAELQAKGPPMPTIELTDLEGRAWSGTDLQGKVAVINFWTLDCGWCERELPGLARLADDYEGDPDVVVLSIGAGSSPDALRAHLTELEVALPTLVAPEERAKAWNITRFPTTWVIDRKGRIAASVTGYSSATREEFGWRIEHLRRR